MEAQQTLKVQQAQRVRAGMITIAALTVLTGIEYWISVSFAGTLLYLSAIALAKAGLIMNHFMHIAQVRYQEGGH